MKLRIISQSSKNVVGAKRTLDDTTCAKAKDVKNVTMDSGADSGDSLVCSICNRTLSRKQRLLTHLQSIHGVQRKIISSFNGEYFFRTGTRNYRNDIAHLGVL